MKTTEIKKFLNDREEKGKILIKEKKEDILNKFNTIISKIVHKYTSIQKIFIYGSILNNNFNISSDLDVYVEKISAREFWEIYRILNNEMNIEIDLNTQNDDAFLIENIKKHGKIIYERKN